MDENKPEVRSDIDQIYSAVMLDSEALEEAKMTLEIIKKTDPGVYDEMINDTLSLIRRALSTSILSVVDRLVDPDQEPVAWTVDGLITDFSRDFSAYKTKTYTRPLYTAPPQREWQGLTDEEIMSLLPGAVRLPPGWSETVRAIEAKLKEKNT